MCRAGPRPSLGCMSHSLGGVVTSPPHLRHFTKWFSPLFVDRSQAGHEVRRLFAVLVTWQLTVAGVADVHHVQTPRLPSFGLTSFLVY